MDSKEVNKVGAAVLCAALAFGAATLAGALLVPDRTPNRPAFPIAGLESGTPSPSHPSIEARLAHASAGRGEQIAGSVCISCHTLEKGAPAQVGPNLFGVAGGPVASVADYDYSPALKQLGGRWTPARLDAWLTRPQALAPGTRMGFAGIPDDAARADVVAYLLTLAAAPAAAGPAPGPAAGPAGDFSELVAKADPKAGETTATASCSACHSFDKGGGAMIGPNLWGVYGRGIAQGADFGYSAALSAKHGTWTADTLDAWLRSPRHFAPGTKMAFPGIADDKTRASVVAYLRTLSDKT